MDVNKGMAADDFAYFSNELNCAYLSIGSAPLNSINKLTGEVNCGNHTKLFTIDENSLALGVSIWL